MYAAHANVSGSEVIAILSGKLSSNRPSAAADHRSPNRWIEKIDSAIALARRSSGTERRNAALTGEVVENRQICVNSETAKNAVEPGTKKPIAASGVAAAMPIAHSRSRALTVSLLPTES